MGPSDFLLHLAGFLAPAAFLAVSLPWAARLAVRGRSMPWWPQAVLVFVAGTAVLAAGLWGFGRDGKMVTYAALVCVAATAQWVALRAWK